MSDYSTTPKSRRRRKSDQIWSKPSLSMTCASQVGDIVLIQQQSVPRVSTKLLAKQLGTKHRSTMALLDKYREAFERIHHLTFQMSDGSRAQGGGRAERIALLTEDQAYLLLAMGRNTDRVVDLKLRLVQAFSDARIAAHNRLTNQQASGWIEARKDSKSNYRLMCTALELSRELAGKEGTVWYHHVNEAKLLRYALTGSTKAMCRDCMSAAMLKVLTAMQYMAAKLLLKRDALEVRKYKLRAYALEEIAKSEFKALGGHMGVLL